MNNKFTGCEIVQMGIQIEKNGRDFFNLLSKNAKNAKAQEVFKILSVDGERQMTALEKVFGNICKITPSETYTEEYFSYMNYLASSYVFTDKDKLMVIAKNIKTDEEAIRTGVQFVKDSILFYEGMKEVVIDSDKGMVDKLVVCEKGHLGRLCDLKNSITSEEDTCGL
ncbi:MAG: ferritin family protein [Candidatus Omnitrophota bacterium]